MKQLTKDFIEQLLRREVQHEEVMGYTERNEYVDDLIETYIDFYKYLYKGNWLYTLGIETKEELEERIYGKRV